MIKQIINKLFSQKISEEDIECAIDENIVDCEHFDDDQDKAYVGVPAPILNPIDEWFASPYGVAPAVTEKQKDYMEREIEIKRQELVEEAEVVPQLRVQTHNKILALIIMVVQVELVLQIQ